MTLGPRDTLKARHAKRRADRNATEAATRAAMKRGPEAENRALTILAKGLSVTSAAAAAGVDRITLYAWRRDDINRRAEDFDPIATPDFASRWDDAIEQGTDLLEEEALRRAKDGVQKPVFGSLGAQQGTGVVGHVQEYSDTLMVLSLKGRRPDRYKDRTEVSGDKDNPIHHTMEVEFVGGGKK